MKKRYEGLDLLRLICAFLVIAGHKRFPEPIHRYAMGLIRVAVPSFFMITGYFLLSPAVEGPSARWEIRGQGKRLKKTALLTLSANGLWFLIELAENIASGKQAAYLTKAFSLESLKKLLLFNVSPFGSHLWYLNAALFALLFIFLMDRLGWRKALYVLAPVLILADLALGPYSPLVFGRAIPLHYTRNWFFYALPNISMGMMFREYDAVERTARRRGLLIAFTLLMLIACMAEGAMVQDMPSKGTQKTYLCSELAAMGLFLLCAQMGPPKNGVLRLLAYWGRNDCTGIYIIHPALMRLKGLWKLPGLKKLYARAGAVPLFVLSLILMELYRLCLRHAPWRTRRGDVGDGKGRAPDPTAK